MPNLSRRSLFKRLGSGAVLPLAVPLLAKAQPEAPAPAPLANTKVVESFVFYEVITDSFRHRTQVKLHNAQGVCTSTRCVESVPERGWKGGTPDSRGVILVE